MPFRTTPLTQARPTDTDSIIDISGFDALHSCWAGLYFHLVSLGRSEAKGRSLLFRPQSIRPKPVFLCSGHGLRQSPHILRPRPIKILTFFSSYVDTTETLVCSLIATRTGISAVGDMRGRPNKVSLAIEPSPKQTNRYTFMSINVCHRRAKPQ
jgi:hypothetical protein